MKPHKESLRVHVTQHKQIRAQPSLVITPKDRIRAFDLEQQRTVKQRSLFVLPTVNTAVQYGLDCRETLIQNEDSFSSSESDNRGIPNFPNLAIQQHDNKKQLNLERITSKDLPKNQCKGQYKEPAIANCNLQCEEPALDDCDGYPQSKVDVYPYHLSSQEGGNFDNISLHDSTYNHLQEECDDIDEESNSQHSRSYPKQRILRKDQIDTYSNNHSLQQQREQSIRLNRLSEYASSQQSQENTVDPPRSNNNNYRYTHNADKVYRKHNDRASCPGYDDDFDMANSKFNNKYSCNKTYENNANNNKNYNVNDKNNNVENNKNNDLTNNKVIITRNNNNNIGKEATPISPYNTSQEVSSILEPVEPKELLHEEDDMQVYYSDLPALLNSAPFMPSFQDMWNEASMDFSTTSLVTPPPLSPLSLGSSTFVHYCCPNPYLDRKDICLDWLDDPSEKW